MTDRTDDIKRVLITGAAGSAAHYLIQYLRETRPHVMIYGLCRRRHARDVPGVALHEADILDTASLIRGLQWSGPDVVFHLAANPDKGFEAPSAMLTGNAVGTCNLLEAVRIYSTEGNASGAVPTEPVIVNVSSSEVYGAVTQEDIPITESCPFRPQSPYAVAKAAADHLGAVYHKAYGLKVVTTRAFSYMNDRRPDLFTSAFARQIVKIERGEQKTLKHGNLDSVRTLMSARDVARAYWAAATRCEFGQAYNIGGDSVSTVGGVLDRLCWMSEAQTGRSVPREQDPALLRPADVTLQVPDSTKFRAATGWRPEFDLETELKSLLTHWRKEAANGR